MPPPTPFSAVLIYVHSLLLDDLLEGRQPTERLESLDLDLEKSASKARASFSKITGTKQYYIRARYQQYETKGKGRRGECNIFYYHMGWGTTGHGPWEPSRATLYRPLRVH